MKILRNDPFAVCCSFLGGLDQESSGHMLTAKRAKLKEQGREGGGEKDERDGQLEGAGERQAHNHVFDILVSGWEKRR